MQIVITTRRIQNRKHKKKRINKKWAKLYGFTEYEVQEKGKPIVVGGRGRKSIMYVTLDDYKELMEVLGYEKM